VEKIVLMAHFDTKIETPGAMDNAAGVAVLLGLAQSLASFDLPFGLEFVAFNGEEYLPIGDDEYLRRGEADFPNILAAINFDGVGAALGANSLTALAASAELEGQAKCLMERHPAFVWVEPWPESNHSTFAFRGVPSLAFSSSGVRHLAHTPADTLEQVSEAKLYATALLAAEIIDSLQGRPAAWSRAVQ
jgi:Zn-dependent M28 family amino/carboxypeptidase